MVIFVQTVEKQCFKFKINIHKNAMRSYGCKIKFWVLKTLFKLPKYLTKLIQIDIGD